MIKLTKAESLGCVGATLGIGLLIGGCIGSFLEFSRCEESKTPQTLTLHIAPDGVMQVVNIDAAVEWAKPGDTIVLEDGTYFTAIGGWKYQINTNLVIFRRNTFFSEDEEAKR